MGTSKKPNGFGVPTNTSLAQMLNEQATPGTAMNMVLRTGSFGPALRAMGEDAIAADIRGAKEEMIRAEAETKAAQERIETYLTMAGAKTFEEFEAWAVAAQKHEAELPALKAQAAVQKDTPPSLEVARLKQQLAAAEGEVRSLKGHLSRAIDDILATDDRLRQARAAAVTAEVGADREVRKAKVDRLLHEYASWGRITPVEHAELTQEIADRFGNDPEKAEAHLKAYYSESRINTGRAAAHRSVKARASGALEMTPAQLHELHEEDPDAFDVAMQERREARGGV